MNKNFKVIQIHGLSGILLLCVLLTGVFCGFVLFPIWVLMMGWNAIVADILKGPEINYIQSALLWAFLALSLYMGLKNSISVKIQKDDALGDIDIKSIIKEARNEDISENNNNNEETKAESIEKSKEEINK